LAKIKRHVKSKGDEAPVEFELSTYKSMKAGLENRLYHFRHKPDARGFNW
jgi:hypothetical protein